MGISSTASLGGGRIYMSNDSGSKFDLIHEIRFDYTNSDGETNSYPAGRTEIEFTADDQLITLTRTVVDGTFKPLIIKGSVNDYINNQTIDVPLPIDQDININADV